jgi:hypothetical protein
MKSAITPLLLAGLLGFSAPAQTDERNKTAEAGIRLREAPLQQALEVYAQIKGRTLLQHPLLRNFSVSLDSESATAATALEDLLRQHGIATISDGDKFVMVVPRSLTNSLTPHSKQIVPGPAEGSKPLKGNEIFPRGTINFPGTDLHQVLQIYGALINRAPVFEPGFARGGRIHLVTVTPLTKAEMIYALETLFAWNGVAVSTIDEKSFKVASVSAPKTTR